MTGCVLQLAGVRSVSSLSVCSNRTHIVKSNSRERVVMISSMIMCVTVERSHSNCICCALEQLVYDTSGNLFFLQIFQEMEMTNREINAKKVQSLRMVYIECRIDQPLDTKNDNDVINKPSK
jgi:hypothetical protein